MTTDDRAHHLHAELEAALEAVREHERVSARLDRATVAETSAREAAATARKALASEEADVDRLESFSPTRIWATLRGRRDTDLDRERAEQQVAEYAVARAEAWLLSCHDEVRRAQAELEALGDVARRRDDALAAKEQWLLGSPGPVGEQLATLADQMATTRAELKEVGEALDAAGAAIDRLRSAAGLLDGASGWASYDTFLGGGLLGDAMKYDRMDQAQEHLHAADRALRHLANELADVGVSVAVQGLAVDGFTQTFDIWFDNIFSDWAVRDRIAEAARRTAGALRTVQEVNHRLETRGQQLLVRRDTLRLERERLLSAR